METLISSRLFGHFAETFREGKTITENKVTDAYGEFISQLSLLANGEQAVIDKLRHLRILELELALYRDIPGHRPEHVMEIYLTKTTSLVKMEIELLLFSVEHPECQVSSDIQKRRSGVPSIHWNGSTTSLMELIASLDYSGLITNDNGARQSFAGLVAAFEEFFNITLPKPYDLRADLARRKKNLSVLLPKLKENYEKNIVKCGLGQR